MSVQLYVGHEYTVKNLEFAMTVEPDSVALEARLEWARSKREVEREGERERKGGWDRENERARTAADAPTSVEGRVHCAYKRGR